MFTLHQFQVDLKSGIYKSWEAGNENVVAVSPTGSGKTVVMSSIAQDTGEPTVAIAHRQELVQQISLAMARMDIPHNIIAPDKIVKVVISQHIKECGMSYLDRRGRMSVAGVNTLWSRRNDLMQWANTIRYWEGDECHHFLADNQWGRCVGLFPNSRGVGFTASPVRCDRKSLHVDQGGVFDDMVVGPTPRELIDQGFLSDYRIFGVPQSISESDLTISSNTGEFTGPSMRAAAEKSTITGDVVQHYLKIALGKRGITFCVDVEQANKTAEAFRNAGVPAEAVSAKTPDTVRNAVIDKFRRGAILQLVNVDLFGEGFDVPAVEVVSMARPTQSFGLFIQQFGRALRTFDGKTHGIIIDHVGNVKRHGLPDAVRGWSLFSEQYGKRGALLDPNVMPTTSCVECFRTYEAITKQCPYCGNVAEPENRSAPKFIDGDLIEFSPELLKQLRQQAEAAHAPFNSKTDCPGHLRGTAIEHNLAKLAGHRQMAHNGLSDAIGWWAGVRRDKGMGDSEIYRRFYHTFGVDVLTAQGLQDRAKVEELTGKIVEGYWS